MAAGGAILGLINRAWFEWYDQSKALSGSPGALLIIRRLFRPIQRRVTFRLALRGRGLSISSYHL
jgi:hypothetical protein